MTQIVIVAHHPLASALESVARHVYPDCAARLSGVDIEPQLSLEQATSKLVVALDALRAAAPGGQPGEILLLVDVLGATPANAAQRVAQQVPANQASVQVLSGVNVPMLWRSLCYAEEPLDEVCRRAFDGAMRGVERAGPAAET